MRTVLWANYFVPSTRSYAAEGHLPAENLRDKIKNHDGSEAYHCAYDLEPREDFSNYSGLMRPALGYVWFDFDSHDGGIAALADTKAFVKSLEEVHVFICYSGSKGFHVGVPFDCFDSAPSPDLGKKLNALATTLKATYKTLDTTIYNANRKFRALGSKHPKTGLYKINVSRGDLFSPNALETIREAAKTRGSLEIPLAEGKVFAPLATLFKQPVAALSSSATLAPKKKDYTAPSGEAAFKACGFLAHCRDNQPTVAEPQWYAALSVVARLQEGAKQCHQISYKHPSYSVSATNAKIDQALAESGPRTCENISSLWDGCARCPLFGKVNSPVNIFDRRFWDLSEKGALIPKYNELLEEFEKRHAYKTIADMKTAYTFNGTHYVDTNPIEIKNFAEASFHPKPKEKERQEFLHKVFANNVARRTFFTETTEDKINFKNGILEINSLKINAHSADYGFRAVLPYNYDPSAECPTFKWWIDDVMAGDPELIAILQEFMGYVIRGGEYKYHKALWLSGTGRNGKSTFLDVIKALIGADNYSTLSIKAIVQDKFSSSELDGKIVNFSEETSPEELSDSGPFKNLTGDGDVSAQKKYGDGYKFRNRAKLIMTYNEIPELRDLSAGMLARPIIIPWTKDMTADEMQDKTVKARLLSELPGIFNFALAGWKRLEEQGQFTYSAKSELAKTSLREASCSALQWIQNYLTFLTIDANSSNREVRTPAELYEAYRETEGRYAYKSVKFFRRINEDIRIKNRRRVMRNSTEYFSILIRQKSSFDAAKSDLPQSPRITTDLPQIGF